MKRILLGLVAAIALAAQAYAASVPAYIQAAIADPARAGDAPDDARRKPAELMAFAGVKPGDKVVDLIPGGGYFTRIFSKIVGGNGHVYAIWPDEYAKMDSGQVSQTEALAKDSAYANVSVLHQPAANFTVPEPVDIVWTSLNYHDYSDKFMGSLDQESLDKQVFRALKPGGVFMVVDHAAEPGSKTRDTGTLHRIDPEFVKKQVLAAGFIFAGESGVLHNPADDHTRKVFDKTIRGHTDQFIFKFRKPD